MMKLWPTTLAVDKEAKQHRREDGGRKKEKLGRIPRVWAKRLEGNN